MNPSGKLIPLEPVTGMGNEEAAAINAGSTVDVRLGSGVAVRVGGFVAVTVGGTRVIVADGVTDDEADNVGDVMAVVVMVAGIGVSLISGPELTARL